MEIKQEDIEKLMKKTGCTQEKANGDRVDAVIDIEKNKSSNNDKIKDLTEKIKKAIKKKEMLLKFKLQKIKT